MSPTGLRVSHHTTRYSDPSQATAGVYWLWFPALIWNPFGSRIDPSAATRAPTMSFPPPKRSSVHTTRKWEPSDETAGSDWYPEVVAIGMPSGSSTVPSLCTRAPRTSTGTGELGVWKSHATRNTEPFHATEGWPCQSGAVEIGNSAPTTP